MSARVHRIIVLVSPEKKSVRPHFSTTKSLGGQRGSGLLLGYQLFVGLAGRAFLVTGQLGTEFTKPPGVSECKCH